MRRLRKATPSEVRDTTSSPADLERARDVLVPVVLVASSASLILLLAPRGPTLLLSVAAVVTLACATGVLLAIWMSWQQRRTAEPAMRAADRERRLLRASQQMAASSAQDEVEQVVARTAHDLLGQATARAVVWEEQGDAWVAIASAGPSRIDVAASDRLPAAMWEHMADGEPWVLDAAESAELQGAYGLEPRFPSYVYTPLPRRDGPRAVLALSCVEPPDPELPEVLRRFAQEVSMAEDRARLLAEVAEREARLDSLLQGSSDIIGMLDDEGIITYVNRATLSVHGHHPEDLLGTNVFDLFHPDDRGRVLRDTLTGDLQAGVQVAHRMYDANGGLRHVETMVSRPAGTTSGYILNVRDVTERRALEAEILHHAHHDALTGLANRRSLTARLDDALEHSEHTGVPVALIMFDLDDFKPVNDTYGHQAGDEVLVEVGRRLTDGVRGSDVPARMGGDEFAVILHDAGNPEEVAALAERLHACLLEPITLQRRVTVRISASMGVASSWEGCIADELLREADQLLYVDKRAHQAQALRG